MNLLWLVLVKSLIPFLCGLVIFGALDTVFAFAKLYLQPIIPEKTNLNASDDAELEKLIVQ